MWESNDLDSSAGEEPGGHETSERAPAGPSGLWADEFDEDDEEMADDGQVWSPEAAAARSRARRRWRALNPGPLLPSLVLSEEEASALLPPDEAAALLPPVEQPSAAVEPEPEPELEPVLELEPEPVEAEVPAPVEQPAAVVEPDPVTAGLPPAPQAEWPVAPWSGPVLQGMSTPRVFSALASAAGTPWPNGGSNGGGVSIAPAPPAPPAMVLPTATLTDPPPAPPQWTPAPAGTEPAQGVALALLGPVQGTAPPAEQEQPPTVTHAVAPWLPAPVPGTPATATSYGPPGKRRSPALVVLLSVVTLGFYALWWHHRVNREMAEFDPRMSVDASQSTWAVGFPVIVGWLVAALAGARYLLALTGTPTADLPISAEQSLFLAFAPLAIPYLELMVPFSAAAVLMTNERARVLEDRVGIPGADQLHPVDALAWLAVPIAGGLVGMAQMQQHLNEVWRRVAG